MKLMKAKKAIAGLDFMQNLAIAVFVIVMLFFVLAIVGANLSSSTTDANALALIANFTAAIGGFGSNIALWLTLGGIVVLVGIVVVIIVMMRRSNLGGDGGL